MLHNRVIRAEEEVVTYGKGVGFAAGQWLALDLLRS